MNQDFLESISSTSEFISESKILTSIYKHDKNVIIYVKDKALIQSYWFFLKKEIELVSYTEFAYIELDSYGKINKKILNEKLNNSRALINYMDTNYKDKEGYFFVTYRDGIYFLYHDGKLDENIKSMLATTKEMEEALQTKKTVEELEEIFSEFAAYCKSNKEIKEYLLSENNKIKSIIKEQELRNCLIEFIKKRVSGVVQQELCTDLYNDEESVDIFINGQDKKAIVEVKFAFDKEYYDGNLNYNFKDKTKAGLSQLNKYLNHLLMNCGQVIHYAYLYMFLALNKEIAVVKEEQENIYQSLHSNFSSAFNSSFKKIVVNDLRECLIDSNHIVFKS